MRAAGDLNEPLVLQRSQHTNSTNGSRSQTYQHVALVWGRVQVSRGTEGTAAGRLASAYPLTITLRRRTDIAEGWRIDRAGQLLRVVSVTPGAPRDPFMKVSCQLEEGSNDGA